MDVHWKTILKWSVFFAPLLVTIAIGLATLPAFYHMRYEVTVTLPEQKRLIAAQRSTIELLQKEVDELQQFVLVQLRPQVAENAKKSQNRSVESWILNRLNSQQKQITELQVWRWSVGGGLSASVTAAR